MPTPAIEPHDTGKLIDAWRHAHYAAQAAAELGKGWGEEQPDDSHSSSLWDAPTESLRGVPAAATGHTARIHLPKLGLSIVDANGVAAFTLDPVGHTPAAAITAVHDAAAGLLGAPRQTPRPAPDLPEHTLAHGATLSADTDALLALTSMYAGTDAMLRELASRDDRFLEPSCWPHHFDLASLAIVATDDAGAMTKTVGVGVTPPDSLVDTGYWYVSPWSRDGFDGPEPAPLSMGRWIPREGAPPMAVLPLADTPADSAESRTEAVRAFIDEATAASLDMLDAAR